MPSCPLASTTHEFIGSLAVTILQGIHLTVIDLGDRPHDITPILVKFAVSRTLRPAPWRSLRYQGSLMRRCSSCIAFRAYRRQSSIVRILRASTSEYPPRPKLARHVSLAWLVVRRPSAPAAEGIKMDLWKQCREVWLSYLR